MKVVLSLHGLRYQSFTRKNGRTGQKLIILDDNWNKVEIECVDKEDFDFSELDESKVYGLICEVRNQRVSIKYGETIRETYLPIFKAIGMN